MTNLDLWNNQNKEEGSCSRCLALIRTLAAQDSDIIPDSVMIVAEMLEELIIDVNNCYKELYKEVKENNAKGKSEEEKTL